MKLRWDLLFEKTRLASCPLVHLELDPRVWITPLPVPVL